MQTVKRNLRNQILDTNVKSSERKSEKVIKGKQLAIFLKINETQENKMKTILRLGLHFNFSECLRVMILDFIKALLKQETEPKIYDWFSVPPQEFKENFDVQVTFKVSKEFKAIVTKMIKELDVSQSFFVREAIEYGFEQLVVKNGYGVL